MYIMSSYTKTINQQNEYNNFSASYNMWKKAHSISAYMVENTNATEFTPLFSETVRSFIGELESLKRYNYRNLVHPPVNKCANVVIPNLKLIVRLIKSDNKTLVRHEVSQLHRMTSKMCRRFNKH